MTALNHTFGAGLRRRFQFYAGADELPLLEAAVREHGTVQGAVIAALREQAAARLLKVDRTPAEARANASRGEDTPALTSEASKLELAPLIVGDEVELYSADAARVLGITTEAVRSRIERGALLGRRDGTGHWLVRLDRDLVRRSDIDFDPRGAAALLGTKAATIRRRCAQGRFPDARNDGAGWSIPLRDLLT